MTASSANRPGGSILRRVRPFWRPLGFWWQLSSVIAFRFFDIVKLPPASVLDRGRQNGFTVMLDDIFAAVYAILVINSMAWVAGFYGAASPIWILR